MSRRPAGSGALRSALSKAEEAAAALSSAGGAPVLNEVLLPLIQVRRAGSAGRVGLLGKEGRCRAVPVVHALLASGQA